MMDTSVSTEASWLGLTRAYESAENIYGPASIYFQTANVPARVARVQTVLSLNNSIYFPGMNNVVL